MKTKWDFADFFVSIPHFLEAIALYQKDVESLTDCLETLSLEQQLKEYYALSLQAEKLISYAELHFDLDVSNELFLQYKNQAHMEKSKLEPIKNKINKEILKIELSLDDYLRKNISMKPYQMLLYEVLRLKDHTISSSTIQNENVLISQVNSLYTTLVNVEMPVEEVEIQGDKVKATFKNYNQKITSQDREVRKTIFTGFLKSLKNCNKSISGFFLLRYQMCYDIAREEGYTSILDSVICKDDLDKRIFENLVSSVHEHFPLLNRYIALKKRKLGLEEFHFYDLTINSDYNPKFTFLEGVELVKKALQPLGKEYMKVLLSVLNGGMLDVFPSKHKYGGGYHWRNYTKPMILMNYKENFREVATIGHELGHAVNGVMIRDSQEFQNFHFSIFLSEIASMVNEDRVEKYMYTQAEEKNKIIHLEQIIDKKITAIFFQTMLFEFQREVCSKIERGESISADFINRTFYDFFQKYYSAIVLDEDVKYLWETRIHLFYDVHRYYNFQYAIGEIVALVINQHIDEGNIENYLSFLKIGGSKPTLEALSIAGVDLLKKDIYQDAFVDLEKLLNEYEELLGK